MARYEIKYREIIGSSNKYKEKVTIIEAENEMEAKDKLFSSINSYDGYRRPRVWVLDIKELVEEDATQAGGITGPTSLFGSGTSNKVDGVYMELLNLEDYK